jgi:hypothetical protein
MTEPDFCFAEEEQWLPVVGYEGCYSVSSLGRVRSEKRTVANGPFRYRILDQRVLKQWKSTDGYMHVELCKEGKKRRLAVGKLVANAFFGPASPGKYLLRGPLGKSCNAVTNLHYNTLSKNDALMVASGALAQPWLKDIGEAVRLLRVGASSGGGAHLTSDECHRILSMLATPRATHHP